LLRGAGAQLLWFHLAHHREYPAFPDPRRAGDAGHAGKHHVPATATPSPPELAFTLCGWRTEGNPPHGENPGTGGESL